MKRSPSSTCQTKRSGWRRSVGVAGARGDTGTGAVAAVGASCDDGGASPTDASGCRNATAAAGVSAAVKCAMSTVAASPPMRSSEIGPPSLTACPFASACGISALAPIAAREVASRSCARALSVAARSWPSALKAAIGSNVPASKRTTRSASGRSGPARSSATTRRAAVPSPSRMCEQAQVSARPTPASNPRRRSNRGEAAGAKVAAIRAIWAAAGSSRVNCRELIVADVGAPKMAAPVAFAHTIWVPSVLHSHAGNALVATGASRPSRKRDSWNPDPLIARFAPSTPLQISAPINPELLMSSPAGVHERFPPAGSKQG